MTSAPRQPARERPEITTLLPPPRAQRLKIDGIFGQGAAHGLVDDPREAARHYAIARGSAFECLAVLDLLELEAAPNRSADARAVLVRLMMVLTALVRR